jgi:hypothetical protein
LLGRHDQDLVAQMERDRERAGARADVDLGALPLAVATLFLGRGEGQAPMLAGNVTPSLFPQLNERP